MTEHDPRPTAEGLLVAAGHGDLGAFADLYGALASQVHGLAIRVVRDAGLAEEVTQEVFLQVWQCGRTFDPARGSARAWVLTIAHRRAVDRVRSTAASRRRDRDHASDQARWLPRDETETRAIASSEAASVRSALAQLTAVQRDAIELAYFGGHTHLEVSRLMACPPGTAKSRIREGLAALRDALVIPLPEPA